MEPKDEIGRFIRPATLVSSVIVASLVVYLALVIVVRTALGSFRGLAGIADMQPLRYAAYGAAAAVIILLLILRPRLFKKRAGEDVGTALLRLQRAALLTMVLAEGPAIIGLVLFFVGGNAADFYKLLFASIVLTFIHFPRRGAWEDWLKG